MEDTIHCHDDEYRNPVFRKIPIEWRPPTDFHRDGGQGQPYRTCSYCGSMHPMDLLAALKDGATMHGSDWKYGWPHKFYTNGIKNPIAGKQIRSGSTSSWDEEKGERIEEIHYSNASATTDGKFYNIHLKDLNPEQLAELIPLLDQHTGILFHIHPEKGLGYAAPYAGYQR